MKKLWAEFKKFISRGNVLDLAVGMIIGAAFTAIVTALVNGIFKPLIDMIPMGDVQGLITILISKDEAGAVLGYGVQAGYVLEKSLYINWGAFIMAIVNFLITAVVLFAIVKVINTVRENMEKGINAPKLTKEERATLKAQGMNRKQMKEWAAKRDADIAAQKAAETAANAPETTDQILKDIRELLAERNEKTKEEK